MFFITDVGGTPKYEYIYTIGVAGTDYKCNYYTDHVGTMVLTLNQISNDRVVSFYIYFVDSYVSSSQSLYAYISSGYYTETPSTNDEHLIIDLTMSPATALKLSFSLVLDTTNTYSMFIMRVEPSITKIIRYRYEPAGSAGKNTISYNTFERDY
jgi:hypothetical protein